MSWSKVFSALFVTRVCETCARCHDSHDIEGVETPGRAEALLTRTSVIKGYRCYVDAHLADRSRADKLAARYHDLTVRWHQFDLQAIEDVSAGLLGEYRLAKKQALKDRDASGR